MKNLIKTFFIVSVFSCIACDKDDDNDNGIDVTGSWNVTELEYTNIMDSETIENWIADDVTGSFIFTTEGTGSLNMSYTIGSKSDSIEGETFDWFLNEQDSLAINLSGEVEGLNTVTSTIQTNNKIALTITNDEGGNGVFLNIWDVIIER